MTAPSNIFVIFLTPDKIKMWFKQSKCYEAFDEIAMFSQMCMSQNKVCVVWLLYS